MSRRFKYVGPFDEVECAGQIVARGEVAEFDSDAAAGLDGQEAWEHVPDPERSKAAKKAAAKRADDNDDSQEG